MAKNETKRPAKADHRLQRLLLRLQILATYCNSKEAQLPSSSMDFVVARSTSEFRLKWTGEKSDDLNQELSYLREQFS